MEKKATDFLAKERGIRKKKTIMEGTLDGDKV